MKNKLKVGDILIAVDDVGFDDDQTVLFIKKGNSYTVTEIEIRELDVYGYEINKELEFEIVDESGLKHTFSYETLNKYDSDYFFDTFKVHRVKKIKSILQ